MNKTKKLQEGQKVIINIPFTYYIGEEGYHSGKILKTVADCEAEAVAELESGQVYFSRLSLQSEINPKES